MSIVSHVKATKLTATNVKNYTRALSVALIGESQCVRALFSKMAGSILKDRETAGKLRVVAIFCDGVEDWADAKRQGILVRRLSAARKSVELLGIRHGVLALPAKCSDKTLNIYKKALFIFQHLFVCPETVADTVRFKFDSGKLVLHTNYSNALRSTYWPKRLLDITGALFVIALSWPAFLLIALTIRFSSPGSIFYGQKRIGRGNRIFTAFKFRTMRMDADRKFNGVILSDPQLRHQWEKLNKLKSDPRVTPIGKVLRRFSLDELPQLWNIVWGDMSLVGPRPIVISEVERYGHHYSAYERVRPGLTGLWQVSGRNNTTYQERVNYDSFYVHNHSFRLDLKIFARTLQAVISGVGAY